jgi:hypothetical protein
MPRLQNPKLRHGGAYTPILLFIAILNSYRCVEFKIVTAKLLQQQFFFFVRYMYPYMHTKAKAILKLIIMGLSRVSIQQDLFNLQTGSGFRIGPERSRIWPDTEKVQRSGICRDYLHKSRTGV